jgi:Asp-tRNA(Asn)/Glu-tRNA(Gln) amidotransferase A subunit family amidase
MLAALAPGFRAERAVALEELEVAVAWTALAEPCVRARVEAAAALFPRARQVDFPFPEGIGRLFMHEVAGVHRSLFAEHADDYGENVRTKVERCLEITEAEAEAARRARAQYRTAAETALGNADLLLTPTLAAVPPPSGTDDLDIRERMIRFTFPFNTLGWPALALPCGPAEDGLPASVQLIGRPGADALVLAAGEALEAAQSWRIQTAGST